MKRLFCVLLALVMVLAFAACGQKGNTNAAVTVYIPDTIEVYMADGTKYAAVSYAFEDGWQEKESFTATMSGDTDAIGGSGAMVYSNKKTTQEVSNGATMEIEYNDQGQQILMINRYASGGRREVTYTYDAVGRVASETVKMYETADSEATTTTTEYTYTDMENGSVSTQDVNGYVVMSDYDKNGRQVSQSVIINGKETNRTEVTYDAFGNMLSQITYANGEKQMEVKYTWKAVEVSSETAARLPQFKREK